MNNMQPGITVIVPVYNVCRYLNRCVRSLINQTYKNLKIILIDDGSNDGSAELCDKWAESYCIIHAYHFPNAGLSVARNRGLDMCDTDFVAFVDSDDFVSERYIELLYQSLEYNSSDMAICSVNRVDEEGNPLTQQPPRLAKKTSTPAEIASSQYDWQLVVAWNKLYRMKLWKDLRYPAGKLHEDEFVYGRLIVNSQRISLIPNRLYHYVNRDGSIMNKPYSCADMDVLDVAIERIKLFKESGFKNSVPEAFMALVQFYQSAIRQADYANEALVSRLKLYSGKIRQIVHNQIPVKGLSFKQAIYHFGFLISPYYCIRMKVLLGSWLHSFTSL